jgi:hypothetical protein
MTKRGTINMREHIINLLAHAHSSPIFSSHRLVYLPCKFTIQRVLFLTMCAVLLQLQPLIFQ